jgi:hypothetical protein
MPAKKMKQSVVTIPTTWLVAGALVLAAAVGVKAYSNSVMQRAAVDEVKLNSSAVQTGTYTGTVNREPTTISGKPHERYTLTTDAGTKYVLVGLKREYEPNPENNKPLVSPQANPVKGQGSDNNANGNKNKTGQEKSNMVPKSSPKADLDDVNSFEQYVGKKVTITGMVVPVGPSDVAKASHAPAASAMQKNKPVETANGPEKSPNGVAGQNPNKPDMGATQKSNKPLASVSPNPTKPNDGSGQENPGWDLDRLVVKSISVVQ